MTIRSTTRSSSCWMCPRPASSRRPPPGCSVPPPPSARRSRWSRRPAPGARPPRMPRRSVRAHVLTADAGLRRVLTVPVRRRAGRGRGPGAAGRDPDLELDRGRDVAGRLRRPHPFGGLRSTRSASRATPRASSRTTPSTAARTT